MTFVDEVDCCCGDWSADEEVQHVPDWQRGTMKSCLDLKHEYGTRQTKTKAPFFSLLPLSVTQKSHKRVWCEAIFL